MDKFLSLLGSNVCSNIIAIISILIPFVSKVNRNDIEKIGSSSKFNNNINHSTIGSIRNYDYSTTNKYYFSGETTNSIDDGTYNFIISLILIFTYFLCAFLGKALFSILLILNTFLIVRYAYLKIANIRQLIIPYFVNIIIFLLVNFPFQPTETYWKQVSIKRLSSFSVLCNFVILNIYKFLKMFFRKSTRDLAISIIFNVLVLIFISFQCLHDLFQPKNKIEVRSQKTNIYTIICLTIIFIIYRWPAVLSVPFHLS